MRKLAFILSLALTTTFVSCAQQAKTNTKTESKFEDVTKPIMKFETEVIDYGTIEQGANGERSFKFTNIGQSPLIIEKVKGSCGCTVPTKPEEPIMEGNSGEIKVKYDTKRLGKFRKTVTITSNASDKPIVVSIKGEVLKKEIN